MSPRRYQLEPISIAVGAWDAGKLAGGAAPNRSAACAGPMSARLASAAFVTSFIGRPERSEPPGAALTGIVAAAACPGLELAARGQSLEPQRTVDEGRGFEEVREARAELAPDFGQRRPGATPDRPLRRFRPFRPRRGLEPVAVAFGEARLAFPVVKRPRLRRIDEVQHDRIDAALEVEEEEVAHEIVARRQRREAALEAWR